MGELTFYRPKSSNDHTCDQTQIVINWTCLNPTQAISMISLKAKERKESSFPRIPTSCLSTKKGLPVPVWLYKVNCHFRVGTFDFLILLFSFQSTRGRANWFSCHRSDLNIYFNLNLETSRGKKPNDGDFAENWCARDPSYILFHQVSQSS